MLLCKNVIVNGRRTSMRLDRETWISLADICAREGVTLHDICSRIDVVKGKAGFSASTRLFVLTYFRNLLKHYEKEDKSREKEAATDINMVLDSVRI